MKALFTAIIDDDPLPLENDHNAQRLGNTPSTPPTTTKKAPQAGLTNDSAPAGYDDLAKRGHSAGL